MIRRRVIVAGQVQGVFFRTTTQAEARARGVSGWVRNLPDGRVEAVFEGPGDAVEAMVDWCREGTSLADVRETEVHEEDSEGLEGFEIR